MKAIIYTRVASENQEISKEDNQSQLIRLEEYCKNKNLEVVKRYYEVGASGMSNQNNLKEIVDYVNSSKETIALCIYSLDRLSRNIFDKYVALLYKKAIENKIEIHFVSDGQVIDKNVSVGDKFVFGMKMGLSKYYSDAISDNVKRAFQLKRERGEITHRAPFGYTHKRKKQGYDVVIDKKTAPFVRQIHRLVRDGKTYSYIKKVVSNGCGDKYSFTYKKIKTISENEFYKGYVVFKGRRYPHKYQLISIDM